MHDLIEQFFRGSPFPSAVKALVPWQRYLEKLKEFSPEPEAEWAVNSDWTPCDYNSPDAYLRGKVDLTYLDAEGVRHIVDWKTGRMYPDHKKQGMVYVAMDPVPNGKYATEFVYIDLPVQTVKWNYTSAEKDDIRERIVNTIEDISADTVYDPTPSKDACRYCPLSFKKGGNCTHAI